MFLMTPTTPVTQLGFPLMLAMKKENELPEETQQGTYKSAILKAKICNLRFNTAYRGDTSGMGESSLDPTWLHMKKFQTAGPSGTHF